MYRTNYASAHAIALLVIAPLFALPQLSAQTPSVETDEETNWYVTWGYNRSNYADSDVHVWGQGANGPFDVHFTQAKAGDMPERFQAKVYFHPGLFTIPQYNFRVARRVGKRSWVGLGWDHMKYKLRDQWLTVTGSAAAGDLATTDVLGLLDPGFAPNEQIELNETAMWWGEGFNLEHSDGMNFVRASWETEAQLWHHRKREWSLDAVAMASGGLVVTSTDFRWADDRTKNRQHVSGFGASAHMGLRLRPHPRVFIQAMNQTGIVRLPWIPIQGTRANEVEAGAGAEQTIRFSERAVSLGWLF
jgi:hypothetical protein